MVSHYGERYVKVDDFVSYCKNLNVETDRQELEHYEKTGVMLPMARVVYPADYVIWDKQQSLGMPSEPPTPDKWPELQRLFEKLPVLQEDYADFTDEELVNCFDREMGQNRFLSRPTPETYKPWSSYKVPVPYRDGQQFSCSSAEHYYSYWQAHQLYLIQKYPDLYKNRVLLDHISEEDKQRIGRPWSLNLGQLREFKGMAHFFDALSFWITVSGREKARTFAPVHEENQVKRLDDSQFQAYQDRLVADAKLVQARFGLDLDNLYSFLFQLIEIYEDYQKLERYKLSKELRNDIIYLGQFIEILTGVEWEAVPDEIGKRYTLWAKQTFRHLDIVAKERDGAYEVLTLIAGKYGDALTKLGIPKPHTRVFSNSEMDELLDYCDREGLSVLFTSLSGMVATESEYAIKFRRVTRYTNMKNVLTGFEYFLKNLAAKSGKPTDFQTLTPLVQMLMKGEIGWFSQFNANISCANAKDATEFLNKLSKLLRDPALVTSEETYWARVFLVTCLARNLTVHMYPEEDEFYSDPFGEMLHAVIFATLYSWQVAKREKWV